MKCCVLHIESYIQAACMSVWPCDSHSPFLMQNVLLSFQNSISYQSVVILCADAIFPSVYLCVLLPSGSGLVVFPSSSGVCVCVLASV